MGRKAWKPSNEDLKMVELMCIAGVTHHQIAEVMKCDLKTLKKNCNEILLTSKQKANSKVAGALFNNAMKGNVTAQIFWLKTRAGWRETDETALAERKPEQIIIQVSPRPELKEI